MAKKIVKTHIENKLKVHVRFKRIRNEIIIKICYTKDFKCKKLEFNDHLFEFENTL
jgi:hypothetical protein